MITAEHSGHRLFNAQPIFPSLLSSLEVNEVFGNVCAFAISDGSLCSVCFKNLHSHLLIHNSSKYYFLSLILAHTQSEVPQTEWTKMHQWKMLQKSKERLYMRTGRWRRVCDSGHFALVSTLGSTGLMCVRVCE